MSMVLPELNKKELDPFFLNPVFIDQPRDQLRIDQLTHKFSVLPFRSPRRAAWLELSTPLGSEPEATVSSPPAAPARSEQMARNTMWEPFRSAVTFFCVISDVM